MSSISVSIGEQQPFTIQAGDGTLISEPHTWSVHLPEIPSTPTSFVVYQGTPSEIKNATLHIDGLVADLQVNQKSPSVDQKYKIGGKDTRVLFKLS